MAFESDASVAALVRGALDDMRELIREEIALARVEMRQEAQKLVAAGVRFGMAGVALWFVGMFLLVAVALGIVTMFAWPAWVGFAIVSIVLAIAGAALLASGRNVVRRVEPLPRTVDSIKENFR